MTPPPVTWLIGGTGVLLVYTAYHRKSPFNTIADVIGGQHAEVAPVSASFTDVNAGPTFQTDTSITGTGKGKAAVAIAFAMQQIGKPYSHSPDGVNSFDCSLLLQKAAAAADIPVPRTSYEQVKGGIGVSPNSMQPGDFIFFRGIDENGVTRDFGHVTMYIGGGKEIQAQQTGTNVKITDVPSGIQAVRRYF